MSNWRDRSDRDLGPKYKSSGRNRGDNSINIGRDVIQSKIHGSGKNHTTEILNSKINWIKFFAILFISFIFSGSVSYFLFKIKNENEFNIEVNDLSLQFKENQSSLELNEVQSQILQNYKKFIFNSNFTEEMREKVIIYGLADLSSITGTEDNFRQETLQFLDEILRSNSPISSKESAIRVIAKIASNPETDRSVKQTAIEILRQIEIDHKDYHKDLREVAIQERERLESFVN